MKMYPGNTVYAYRELSKKEKFCLMFVVATIVALIGYGLAGCAAKRASTSPTPAPITQWEQVNYDNAQIAIHNRAGAKTLVLTQKAGFISSSAFNKLSAAQIKITKIHSDLTPLLKDLPTAIASSDKLKALLDEATALVVEMISDGTAGVTNPESKAALLSDVDALKSAIDSLRSILTAAGVKL